MRSINSRLTCVAGLVVAVFVALSAFALEQAFRESARSARQERLLAQVYLVMAAAEVDSAGRITVGEGLAEPRLDLVGSGLYASIVDGAGSAVWHSHSALSAGELGSPKLPPGVQRFEQQAGSDGRAYFVQSFGVRWTTSGGSYPFTFSIAEDLAPYERQLGVYRRSLIGWLGAMGLLLLAVLWLTLRWGLRPLRRAADELTALESGRQATLSGNYPTELARLTANLNALLLHERTRQQRYRDALADLAHSLKTPLAVLRGSLRDGRADEVQVAAMDSQLERMDRLIGYHLQRAAASGRPSIGIAHPVKPLVERLLAALRKVHADKPVTLETVIEPELPFRGDEGDLIEALGNVLDNAFKWCGQRVRVSAEIVDDALRITVEDDGPGIAAGMSGAVLERGVRADQTVPGHGLGLAVSRDIVESYGGAIAISRSTLGGAAVALQFPAGPVAMTTGTR